MARRNPWSGVAGCIYLGGEAAADGGPTHFVAGAAQRAAAAVRAAELVRARGERAAPAAPPSTALAGEPGPADAARRQRAGCVPPSLQALLQPLETLRQPSRRALPALHRRPAAAGVGRCGRLARGANRIVLDGAAVDVGFSVDLTIDPALQALAQKTAACYTGRQDVCRALGLRRARGQGASRSASRLLEGAMVRMAAVAVIDVASGRIEALAGALSPCARQEFDGPGRDAGCDKRLPYPVQYRPDALLNPAVFHDAMPASTIKPIMAAAFLSDPEVGARWLAAERAAMQRDGRAGARQPARPADALRLGALPRPHVLRRQGLRRLPPAVGRCRRRPSAFGWNAGCADARGDCGKQRPAVRPRRSMPTRSRGAVRRAGARRSPTAG